ncbi:MAG: DUF3604 domain-containing protein [Halioglobus sp.]
MRNRSAMTLRRVILLNFILLGALALVRVYMAVTGALGEPQGVGEMAGQPREPAAVQREEERQRSAAAQLTAANERRLPEKQILFGDLHVHTTYSADAYNMSLPMFLGEGSHPPGDACDFARYCSALDFWSINDHAEGLTPRQWQQTRDMVRQCNAVAGNPANPDMVTFLGWEWTQTGKTAQTHYGHKNVVLRDTADDEVPARPIAAQAWASPTGLSLYKMKLRLMLIAGVADGNPRQVLYNIMQLLRGDDAPAGLPTSDARQRYYNYIRFLQDRDDLYPCPPGASERALPTDCQESARTPTELFAKLDDWGYPT